MDRWRSNLPFWGKKEEDGQTDEEVLCTEVSGGGERVHGWRYFPQNVDESRPVRIWSGPQGEGTCPEDSDQRRGGWETDDGLFPPLHLRVSIYTDEFEKPTARFWPSAQQINTYTHTHINTLKQIHLHTPDGVSILTNVYVCTRVYTLRQSDL